MWKVVQEAKEAKRQLSQMVAIIMIDYLSVMS